MPQAHWTVNDVIGRLGRPGTALLPAPPYEYVDDHRPMGLAVASMKDHTTDEGWALFAGLQHAGYTLCGHGLPNASTDVMEILLLADPTVVVVQDQREWDGLTAGPGFNERERFRSIYALSPRSEIFRVGVLKDAHQKPEYHRASFESFGAHAVIHYYHPRIICHLAPYLRPQHLIRTYHSLDPASLPAWKSSEDRLGCIISGAVSSAYPLRKRLIEDSLAVHAHVLRHPGYHRNGCHTPEYLRVLSSFKVSICTASIYGYALRKLVESTAVGCRVITDLPEDEVMPGGLDRNLTRIHPDTPSRKIGEIIQDLINSYDEQQQKNYAAEAIEFYDFHQSGIRLADDIERMRRGYQ
jgi:hypothetical protein